MSGTGRKAWLASGLVSAVLLLFLVLQWMRMDQHALATEGQQFSDGQGVYDHISCERGDGGSDAEPLTLLPTGIFVQSLQFTGPANVRLTGYVWQRYRDTDSHIMPGDGQVGFVFPEQVEGLATEAYRQTADDDEVIGWYFESTLRVAPSRQPYPFDHRRISVRIWPSEFNRNIVLVPDSESYESTEQPGMFGIESDIVLRTWELSNTYFDYRLAAYNADFGIPGDAVESRVPELHFNIVARRRMESAFVMHVLPLFLVAAMAFGTLLAFTSGRERAGKAGASTASMIGACTALFLITLLAHLYLPSQSGVGDMAYLNGLYGVIYVVLGSLAAYMFVLRRRPPVDENARALRWPVWIGLLYWPVLLGAFHVSTGLAAA